LLELLLATPLADMKSPKFVAEREIAAPNLDCF
jgi:hypothetical protein